MGADLVVEADRVAPAADMGGATAAAVVAAASQVAALGAV
mgnify:CR=1 FL=1